RMYLQNLKQLSHVAIPGFQQDVVETAIVFDEKNDPPMRQIDIARLLGHAMAYQCLYSDRIGPFSWSYMWLNQGFPKLPYKRFLFVVQTLQESLRLDTDFIMKPLISEVNSISDIDSGFYFAYYIKVLLILERQILILSGTLWHLLCKLLTKSIYNKYDVEHFNVKERMEAWTTREHYPVINVTQNGTVITVTIESTNTSKKKWWIPYISTTKEDPGYYRVNYDAQSLEKIADYLNSDQYIRVHVLNRAQIMDDAFHFLIKGQLDLSVFLKLTTYLSMERNYI
ncbi:Decaprenyl-diphosphate synthase subunit 1, partial [Temnothorax longispinosus]